MCCDCMCTCTTYRGGKYDPQSPSCVPSILEAEQQQTSYEALEHRRQRKEQVEAVSALFQLNTGEEHPVPEEPA